MRFSRQDYWSGLPFPYPGTLPNPGIEPTSLMSPTLAGRFFTTSATWEALVKVMAPAQVSKLCGIMMVVTPEVVVPPFYNSVLQSSGSITASL